MSLRRYAGGSALFLFSVAWLAALPAHGQTLPKQLLDRVDVVSPGAVLEMSFKDPDQVPPFDSDTLVNGSKFTACQLTGTLGLFCLDQFGGKDGRLVRNWNPVAPGQDRPLFSCEDSALGFDTSKTAETCTGLTIGDDRSIFVAGKKKSLYSLTKVMEKGTGCRPGWFDLNQEPYPNAPAGTPKTDYCYTQLPGWKDRPLLVDITAAKLVLTINGAPVECSGILGLELKKTLMFFPDPDLNGPSSACGSAPIMIADSKIWGLKGTELLQSATVLKAEDGTASFALATSTLGRVLAKNTMASSALAFQVFDIPAERANRSTNFPARTTQCDSNPQEYGIRASTKSGRVYVTDRNWCETSALEPVAFPFAPGYVAGNPSSAGLKNVVDVNGVDLTLSTYDYGYAPIEPSLAPGESFDLRDCGSGQTCTLSYSNTDPTQGAAFLSRVSLASMPSGMTLFQIENLPDCRWLAQDSKPMPAVCGASGVITGGATAGQQFLNVTPLLPKEVTDQFITNPLPPMYISPEYRAQTSAGRYYFDAFFTVTQEGVTFVDTFQLEFYVQQLTASHAELGCNYYAQTSWPVPVSTLLKWDLVAHVSENYRTVGGPGPATLSYTDILSNIGCGSTRGGGGTTSLFAFNLELSDRSEIVFARQSVQLFYNLYDALAYEACAVVPEDGNDGQTPLTATTCTTLYGYWDSARDKLEKCIIAADYPKQSEAIRNCQSFNSQLDNFETALTAVPACTSYATCRDRANRRGELLVRVLTLRHLFNDRFLPSIPASGFTDPNYDALYPLPTRPPL